MSKRYAFTVSDDEAARFEEEALVRAAPVGSLAIVAIREFIERKQADRKRADGRRKAKQTDYDTRGPLGQVAASPGANDIESEEASRA